MPDSNLRVWFIHDWLTGFRGGERVLLELVRLYPNSRIATLVHVPGTTHPELDQRVASTSFLQNMPFTGKRWRNYLPLFPRAVRSLKLDDNCDLVISASHAVAKGVTVPAGKPHLCYCHTPMRYIWGMEDHYLAKYSPKRLALKITAPSLRRFDRKNDGVTRFIANSKNVAQRILRIYDREGTVVYPGIDENYFTLPDGAAPREDYYLMVSALVPYKRVDLAVECFLQSPKPRRLVIIGAGPDSARLRSLAASHGNCARITFLGREPDEVVRHHLQRCRAFLFPGEEDFGLTPLEAQACGAPVIAYRAGGALETVIDGTTGIFFDHQSEASVGEAIDSMEVHHDRFDPAVLRENALRFRWQHFRDGIAALVAESLAQKV